MEAPAGAEVGVVFHPMIEDVRVYGKSCSVGGDTL